MSEVARGAGRLLRHRFLAMSAFVITSWTGSSSGLAADTEAVTDAGAVTAEPFEDFLLPLFESRCGGCHNEDDRQGMLDLSTATGLMAGSGSGPVVVPGEPRKSLLWEVLHSGEMPPDDEPLANHDIDKVAAWIAAGAPFRQPPAALDAPPTRHDVEPILLLRCAACHGAELRRGGLDLRSIEALRGGGPEGPVAIPGDPDSSPLIGRVESGACPPQDQLLKYFVVRPGTSEIDTLRRWVAAGMPDDEPAGQAAITAPDRAAAMAAADHWAFRPLPRHTPVPAADDVEIANPIDAFVAAKHREQGLAFAPPPRRDHLIRRVYFALTGMPPTVDQLRRWMDAADPEWYPAMIDTLLASPRYGERWGRHWLDIAGYADSEGGQSADNVREFAWKYRDYVIRSFNADKPWDRFLAEQLAGDELAEYRDPSRVTDEVVDQLIATGFLRMGVDETGSRTMNFVPERLGVIADAIDVVSKGVMGMTLECARCHNHKYDPIPQTDYFRFKAIFQPALDEHDWMSWKTRRLEVASPAMLDHREAVNRPLQERIRSLRDERERLVGSWQDQAYERVWPKLAEDLRQEIAAARKVRDGRRTLRQDELVRRFDTEIRPTEAVLRGRHPELDRRLTGLDRDIARLEDRLVPPPTIRALWDRGRPSPTYVLIRGEHERFGRPVGPGVPSALTDGETPLAIEPPWPGAESTGRRLALARWLTAPDHPLTARVQVNRVWAHHFGQGIVKTLDNFGVQGAEPTHPELLDWLARDFVDGGWSLKSLHRRILLSRTYRQSARADAETRRIDPENRLLTRMSLRRLDAEAIRDALVALSGRMDDSLYGRPSPVTVRDDGLVMETAGPDGRFRRSLYLRLRRTEMPSLLGVFDYPEMQPNCIQRTTSTVSLQSLVLKNNARVHEWAGDLAATLIRRTGGAREPIVRLAYQAILSRDPDADEERLAGDALRRFETLWRDSSPHAATGPDSGVPHAGHGPHAGGALHSGVTTLCHTLINAAEFSYLD